MKVLVTGSSGRLGSAVMRDLLQQGHQPMGVDVRSGGTPEAPTAHLLNLTRVDQLMELVAGSDAVCHLGNYPSFWNVPSQTEGYANNVASTFAVFEACERTGVSKVIYASSIQAYGLLGNPTLLVPAVSRPLYLPIDEDHPLLPRDGYPLSKANGEWIAEAFVRRRPELQAFSLRFSWIVPPDHPFPGPPPVPTPECPWPLIGSLYTAVPLADAARAVRRCCQIDRPGHTPLNIVAPHSVWPWTRELIAQTYGEMPELRRPLFETDALISGERAAQLL